MQIPWGVIEPLLAADGVGVSEGTQERLARYLELLEEANSLCGLMSAGELERAGVVHVPDSLSLATHLVRGGALERGYLDVGSGGGFPAIPLLSLFPACRATLVERNTRKAGFLQRVVGALGLSQTRVICGEFPVALGEAAWGVCTARAVEVPEKVLRQVVRVLPEEGVFLCQSGLGGRLSAEKFHVEHVEDAWGVAGLRRGLLEIVRHRSGVSGK